MKRWYVVYTKPSAEQTAVAHLRRQGFDAYLPRCRKVVRHARRQSNVLRPLFPRYLFVGFDCDVDRWRSINGTVGVSRLVCHSERPTALPDGVVDDLRDSEIDDGAVPLSQLVLFDSGARLRVLDGAFNGQTGTYHGMTEAERVVLLFDMIGRQVKVALPIHAVEAV
ncbi:MAG: transcriptional activator RfaH [Alphaproteobacteria bacterium]|nr:transcriptional activator RfaH [Alphaproteobacteria bacterium]